MLANGHLLDSKYRIISLLGKGGMGHVYLAENIKLGNKWAIKEVALSKIKKLGIKAEAEILKKLNHPSLPRIIDLIELDEYLYIVEDYFDGTNLRDIIKKRGACGEEEVVKWALQLCDILHYLHTSEPNPIIYRDMKPANIIIDNQGQVRLVDLGIAREYRDETDGDTLYIGTRGYAAPEQYAGDRQTDVRTDIYGLGATMYHALTGISPCAHPYNLKPVRQYNKGLSVYMERIVSKCTQNDPDLRYRNIQELLADLKKLAPDNQTLLSPQKRQSCGILSKLIIIGSLSPRAGSSFLAANLAALLASQGISTAVLEFPVNIPYLYDALFLSNKSGSGFCSWAHQIQSGDRIDRHHCYIEDGVTWIVLDPTLPPLREWTEDNMLQLLFAVKQIPLVILDVSCNWCHPSLRFLLALADQVYLVADPDPALIDRVAHMASNNGKPEDDTSAEHKIMQLLTELNSKYGNVGVVLNKFTAGVPRNQICLPVEVAACFPFLDPQKVYRSLWNGETVYRCPEFKQVIENELAPLVEKILPMDLAYNGRGPKEGVIKMARAAYRLLAGDWGRKK